MEGEELAGPVPTKEPKAEEEDEIEFEVRDGDEAGAWRCIEAEVEVVDAFKTGSEAEDAEVEDSEEGRWPLTSIWRSMAQQPRFW